MAKVKPSDSDASARWRRRAREVLTALILTLVAVAFLIAKLPG